MDVELHPARQVDRAVEGFRGGKVELSPSP